MREHFRASDYRFVATCAILFAVSFWFSARYFYRAFPEASIDFRITREGARIKAERLLSEVGFQIWDYRHASRFSFDDEAKTFLERELGLERANGLISSQVRIWRWSNRWFRPLHKEEFRVEITPRGELAA